MTQISIPEKSVNVTLTADDLARIETAIDRAIEVAHDLMMVAEEESQRLGESRSAPIEDLLLRKQRLAAEFGQFLKVFKAQSSLFLMASPQKFEDLQNVNRRLSQVLSGNSQHLERALNTNRRRVETILRAVREKKKPAGRYGATGGYAAVAPASVSVGRRYEA